MKRKVIAYICLISILMDTVPVNALSNVIPETIAPQSVEETIDTTEEANSEEANSEEVNSEEANSEEANSEEVNSEETNEDKEEENTESQPKLEDNIFNMYIVDENIGNLELRELGFSIGFNEKDGLFTVSNLSEKALSPQNPDTIIYKINIYDKENKEKLNIDLLGKDTANSDKLNILKETKYDIGDTIKITSFDAKNGLNILGEINGDIKKEKQTDKNDEKVEDYSDGVDNLDYIDNVRFEITETNLKTVYNEAPVIEGLTDLLDVENPDIDVISGVKVTDDHDGTIDNSKIVVQVQEKTETSAILTYTVEDSWGRSISATRNVSAKDNQQVASISENKSTSNTNQSNGLADNTITVEGVPYFGTDTERFKIKFDMSTKSIKIIDADGRLLTNSTDKDYFKIILYDKDMEVKTSVTLLGSDKSDSEKLEEINNKLFEQGDYLGIWHAESNEKLKIGGRVKGTTKNATTKEAVANNELKDYTQGLPQADVSERRFRIMNTGLEEVNNDAPVIADLDPITISRGEDKDLLEGVKDSITDDFDLFNDDNIESEYVTLTHTPFNNTKIGDQIITYTATDRWGKSSTKDRTVTVTSTNPLDSTYIEFMNPSNPNESLFKIGIDAVTKQLVVADLDTLSDEVIDQGKLSSIFKLKVYTQDGVLQKTLNIKGTDKLKTVLRRINGYRYGENDRIELWSSTPENIRVTGNIVEASKDNSNVDIQYTPNENPTENVNDSDYKEDYANGINDADYMKNVRFEIGSEALKYIYNKAPQFIISTDLTVERNGTVDYMNGITVSDDHDNNKLLEKVTHTEIDTSTIGEKYVEYTVVDSWGRSTLVKRKVIVYPENNLLYNYITIKNNQTNEPILSIRFDEDTKKFKVNKLDVSKIPSSLNDEDKLLELKLIKKNNNSIFKFFKSKDNIETITIKKSDLINNNLDELEKLRYSYGDYISFNSYDHANGIFISSRSDILLNGFDDEDQMVNTGFEIKPEGLQITYNNAPRIFGLQDTLYLYRGEKVTLENALKGVSVEDDLDNIEATSVKVKYEDEENLENVDTDKIGTIVLTYEVTDSWGRSAYGSRFVSIISKSVSNDIEFYDEGGNNKLFSLKYNPISHEFDVTRKEEVSARTGENPETTPGPETESQPQPEPEPENKVVFRLNVFNTNGEEVGKLELSEEETLSDEAFNELNNIGVYDNYYFSVWSDKHSRIKIQGDISGTDKLGEAENENESYADGIDNTDHMNNVRFKLRTEGLEAVYNKAPRIIINSKKILTAYAGDEIDYTSDVIVEDDHDKTIPTENIKVNVVENETEDDLKIGKNDINLSVKDSWGREGNINRKILIINGIDKNTIRIMQSESENAPKVMEIGFNHMTNKLVVTDYNQQFVPPSDNDEPNYFSITIKRKGEDGAYTNSLGPYVYNAKHYPSHNNVIQHLSGYNFQYGDRFVISHFHPTRFNIDGKVIDAREDYSDAVDNPENLINTEFEITESGLKAIYTNPDENNTTDNKVIIGPMAPEKFPFKLQIDPAVNKITVVPNSAVRNGILWKYSDNTKVYKFVLIGQDGREKRRIEFTGRTLGTVVTDRNNEYFYLNDGLEYDYGDAIYLWHIEPERSILKGNIKYAREDYSNGVDDPDNMNHVVFKLTSEGVEAVYNEAPEIKGVDNRDVYQNAEFNILEGVSITDNFDTDKLEEITVSVDGGNPTTITTTNSGTVLSPNSIKLDTSTIGEKIITYTARDRWDKETVVTRKITVRPNLYKNVFKVFSDTNTIDPIFEIGFDSVTNKYRVFNQKNERISSNDLSETAFEIRIIGSNKEIKKKITLTGNDRGNSPQLNELNDVDYADNDIIRVYRSNVDAISIEGDVTGDIPKQDQILDEFDKFDYMRNTGFKVSNSGLEAVYNQAPTLNGVSENKTVSKGEVIDLLDGIEVDDDIDNISTKDIAIYVNGDLVDDSGHYTFDSLGTYNIEYDLYDSWGRGKYQEFTITVESKVRDNEIEVYDSNNSLAFKVTFNTTENKFVLKGNETSTTYNSSSAQEKYFEMVVRNIKGEEKYKVILNGDITHDTQQLRQIHEMNFDRYDTIALYGKTANTVRIKGGVVQINNTITNEYANGFSETNNYELVRFKITDDGLKEVTNKKMLISGLEAKSIKRGYDINFLEGVVVNVQDTNNEDYKIEVNSDNFNNLKEGQYTVTYKITNSWGQEIIQTRTITVEPRTELEGVKLNVKNNNGEIILTIGFDSIERKLRVINYRENSTIDSSNTNLAFAINAYDSLGNTLGTIELDGDQRIDQSLIYRLNNFAYIEGYRISIWAKNPDTHLSLDGKDNISTKNNEKAFKSTITPSVDKMENGRFEILSTGLEYIYNKAPEIKDVPATPIDYYKGTLLEIPKSIKVEDDHDGEINRSQIVIDDDQVDYDVMGEHLIKYIVEDSWGRAGVVEGKINVISSIDKNEINIFTTTDNPHNAGHKYKAFGIKFERKADKNKIKIENPDTMTFNPDGGSEKFMTIKIHGADGKVIESCELLSNQNAINNAELNKLNGYEFDLGGYISIEGIKDETKECVKIIGTVVNQKEDYSNGIENLDFIDNVRFKITDFGLESVYNQAPTIAINESVILDAIKGDDIPYMRGVKLRDDHDKLTSANVEVTWNPEEIPSGEYEPYNDVIKGVAKVGVNTLHYKVTDSWGRTCEGKRTINLTNGILDNSILLKSKGMKDMVEFTFAEEDNDAQNNQVTLKLEVKNNQDVVAPGGDSNYYTIRITIPGIGYETRHWWSEHRYNEQFSDFSDKKLPYGSTIEFIETGHPDRLIIQGRVRNQLEDYSDGTQNPNNLSNVLFEVTDCGLKAIDTDRDGLQDNQNLISLTSKESVPLKFKVDPTTNKINVVYSNHVTLYWELRTGENDTVLPEVEVFRMTLTSPDGTVKANVSGEARDKGYAQKFSQQFNNRSYDIGDILTIWHYTPSRVSIKGNVIGAREDYSDGVDNEANLTETAFKLTANGLEAIYKDAPKVTGVKDTKVLKGQPLDLRKLTEEILATDTIDGNITPRVEVNYTSLLNKGSSNDGVFVLGKNSIYNTEGTLPTNEDTITGPPPLDTEEIVVPDKVGIYEVRYSITNSNNRTTEKSSTVVVYDKPKITPHRVNSRIEINSVENTEEAIIERLKQAVEVNDDDDTLYNKTTKLEVVSQNVKPNEEGNYPVVYKATDLYGESSEATINITVSRTISVSVPTSIPFQIVTNLTDKNADSFISGVMKVQNNSISDVTVYLESFTRKDTSLFKTKSYNRLEIINPDKTENKDINWEDLSPEESMTKMALGIYNKEGLSVDSNLKLTEQEPLWLEEGMSEVKLGTLTRATDLKTPYVSKFSFTSKHGKNFIEGLSKGKFNLVFRFE